MWKVVKQSVQQLAAMDTHQQHQQPHQPEVVWEDFFFDNESTTSQILGLCPVVLHSQQGQQPTPPCQPTVWTLTAKILYWLKLILLKMAKSYHAFPIFLFLLPLITGLCLGYCIGKRQQQQNQPQQQSSPPMKKQFGLSLFLRWSSLVMVWSHGLAMTQFTIRRIFGFLVAYMYQSGAGKNDTEERQDGNHCCSKQAAVVALHEDGGEEAKLGTTEAVTKSLPTSSYVEREECARHDLLHSSSLTIRESGIPVDQLPKHVAIIMDGNRRYGRMVYGDEYAGHWDGCRKILECCTWCQTEQVAELTIYAFSTENWNRSVTEVNALMALFLQYCQELRVEAVKRNIWVKVISTDTTRIPANVQAALLQLEQDTATQAETCSLKLNVCLSYGSRGEIVHASRSLAKDCVEGRRQFTDIDEATFGQALLTTEPDLLIRTSGEVRLSNFLLWQLAYAELFFLDKRWPEVTKQDFLQVLQTFASSRQRRFGK